MLDETGELRGQLSLTHDVADCVELFFQPSEQSYRIAHGVSTVPPPTRIAKFNSTEASISIFPIVTSPSLRLLRPKYQIREIVLEDADFDLPVRIEDVDGATYAFPEGFIRDPMWGFGVQKNFKPILTAISKIEKVRKLILNRSGPTGLDNTGLDNGAFYLTYNDYGTMRRAMLRIQSRFQKESLIDREILAHNTILTPVNRARFPIKSRPYKPDTIFKILERSQSDAFSRRDRNALVENVNARAHEIAESEPEKLFKLHKQIELVTLNRLLTRIDEMLDTNTTEANWQKLFSLNPFILTMAFGYSIVVVAEQAHLGGSSIFGTGGKIADFVVKNDKTNNVAIIEIKKPSTSLVSERTYRDGVHVIEPELTGAVMQTLDQRLQFVTNIAAHKANSPSIDIEGYSVACVVIAGRTPQGSMQQKAFELYRGSLKDVVVLTFDELRQRLEKLRDYLSEPLPLKPRPQGDLF
jgi:hypothetical protein